MLEPFADDRRNMPRLEIEYAQPRDHVTPQPAQAAGSRKDALFETSLSSTSKLAVAARLEGLVTVLREAQPQRLQRAVVEAKTITETSFFRDAQPFEALRTQVLPRLIASRRSQRRLRLWSAACSTGQEAYSLALLLVHGFSELADWDIKVIGTDLSDQAIAYATQGRYRRYQVDRGLPEPLLQQYFDHDGDDFHICDEVRSLCEFHVADLGAPPPELPLFDLILLRNVLLYLPPSQRSCVFESAHRQLWQRGFLMLGDAEQAEDSTHLFEPESGPESYFYRPVTTGQFCWLTPPVAAG